IHLDPPRQSSDNQSIHAFVTWQNPLGYDDADIYGYEQPVAYPISCQTPEDRLTQPRVELIEGGARMHLNLPIGVLSEKCRIFIEVRMLPRCVRIDSFDIQASIEINCEQFPNLRYCQKEQTPQCVSLIDVWGKEGKAMVVWQKPETEPMYYVLKYGMGEQRGARPFIARKILQGEEIKIAGNQTHAELVARPGIEYGLQICGIYSQGRNKPPFEVAQVIPFICAECPSDGRLETIKQ
uniref:Fibronectin type-III domain-containing protein n=1 Tax=Bursaphelenchus xylophilus TaxID=6326 RepID=A0A1I7SJ50_BURXY